MGLTSRCCDTTTLRDLSSPAPHRALFRESPCSGPRSAVSKEPTRSSSALNSVIQEPVNSGRRSKRGKEKTKLASEHRRRRQRHRKTLADRPRARRSALIEIVMAFITASCTCARSCSTLRGGGGPLRGRHRISRGFTRVLKKTK